MDSAVQRSRASFLLAYYAFTCPPLLPTMPPRRKRPAASNASLLQHVPYRNTFSPPTAAQNRPSNMTTSQPVTPPTRTSKARPASSRVVSGTAAAHDIEHCPGVIDAPSALRPSPDAERNEGFTQPTGAKVSGSTHSEPSEEIGKTTPKKRKTNATLEQGQPLHESQATVDEVADPELAEEEGVTPEGLQETLRRPPPVNSGYLPLPWKGRLGYVSANLVSTLFKQVTNKTSR